jgi:hypothetical protein
MNDSERLFDITTRLALFVEAIKLGQAREFDAVLQTVNEQVRKLLMRVQYKTLDGLTKAELNQLLVSLRRTQATIYSRYAEQLINSLQQFMQLRVQMSAMAYGSARWNSINGKQGAPKQLSEDQAFAFIAAQSDKETFSPLYGLAAILPDGKDSLWATIKNAPIPANGLYLLPFVSAFIKSAQASVENAVRKAYANKETVEVTIAEIGGEVAKQGASTQLAKIGMQAAAVVETSISHIDQIVAQAVASALFSHYQWHSIIDGSTTTVCRERDRQAYRYGQGPVPPAHYRCRSITVPLASLFDDFSVTSLYAWLKRQPRALQDEIVGSDIADALESGELTAKDFAKVKLKALQLSQFKKKIGLVLLT